MPVTEIETQEQYKAIISGHQLVVVDFYANWCGPCKSVAPHFKTLSDEFGDVIFCKVNVDECQELFQSMNGSSIPDFRFVHKGVQIGKVTGGSPEKLRAELEKRVKQVEACNSSNTGVNYGIKGSCDLVKTIDAINCNAKNETDVESWKVACGLPHTLGCDTLKSDCDAELILRIEFTEQVKLYGIKIAGKIVSGEQNGPNQVRIFINNASELDFDNVKSGKSDALVNITEENLSEDGPALQVPRQKFNRVRNITLFFEDNHSSDEITEISKLVFLGQAEGARTDMSEFKRVAGKAGEAH